MVDVETDGPIPGDYSMISIGAVFVESGLKKTFYSTIRPISEKYDSERLKFSNTTREETLKYRDAKEVIKEFADWVVVNGGEKPKFVSDNNGFDWMFVCWYLEHFLGKNPFGYTSTNLGSLYKGMVKDMDQNFKHLRVTSHTHNPLDDAKGNAEALLALKDKYGLKIDF